MTAKVSFGDKAVLTDQKCRCCGASGLSTIYEVSNIPAHSVLLFDTKQKAIDYPRGNISLVSCPECGFIYNRFFDDGLHEYSERYEETQGFSSTFNVFHRELAESLIKRYNLNRKHVLEIGCGKGEFLRLICEIGQNTGVGFDPSYIPARNTGPPIDGVKFIQDFYSEKYADHKADFIVCKMTLEHIPEVRDFVQTVRRTAGDEPDTVIFFQVPDTIRILKEAAFWDIYYEHCSYFTLASLARCFQKAGFNVTGVEKSYGDQYIMLAASPAQAEGKLQTELPENVPAIRKMVEQFQMSGKEKVDYWQSLVKKYSDENKRLILWGAGSKAVAFLTTLNIKNEIEFAIDINPHKHDTFMAGTGHEIKAPENLTETPPDGIIVVNPIYMTEVEKQLENLGVQADLIPLK